MGNTYSIKPMISTSSFTLSSENIGDCFRPTVSVIMNCLNGEKYLEKAIVSVLRQTYPFWEIIFWDNASTDASGKIARSFGDRVRYFRGEKTVPLGSARNLAVAEACGELIAFLDCDDEWLPEKLELQVPRFIDPDVGIVYSNTYFFYENEGKEQPYYSSAPPSGRVFEKLLADYFLSMETVVLRRSALENLDQWFDDRFDLIEEADLFTRIAHDWKFAYVDHPLSRWRIHDGNLTTARIEEFGDELLLMLAKYDELYPQFRTRYANAIEKVKARAAYRKAQGAWRRGQKDIVRQLLKPWIRKDPRLIIPYWLSFLSYSQYQRVFHALRRFS